MRNLHIYGFINTPVNSLELPIGIANQVQIVNNDGLSVLIEPEVELESLRNNDVQLMHAVLCHDRVICEVFRQTTILPLRFGICFSSLERLIEHLKSDHQQYLEKLKNLSDKAEYTLKFTQLAPPEPTLPSEVKGREYFLAKKQRYQMQQDFQVAQTQEWEKITVAIAQAYNSAIISQPEGQAPRIYLLVNRKDEPLLLENFQAWQQLFSHWEWHLGEALPPYHFIDTAT